MGVSKLQNKNKQISEILIKGSEIMNKPCIGVEIVRTGNLPTVIIHENNEKEIIHSMKVGDTVYCSEEVYSALKNEMKVIK